MNIIMVKSNLIVWHPVISFSRDGNKITVRTPEILNQIYKGNLASEIASMQKQTPISFAGAVNLLIDQKISVMRPGNMGREYGEYEWFDYNFVTYISSLGFHIELTGDEFETSESADC